MYNLKIKLKEEVAVVYLIIQKENKKYWIQKKKE